MYLKLNGIEMSCGAGTRWADLLDRLPDGGAGALGISVQGRTCSLNDPAEEYAFARVLTYANYTCEREEGLTDEQQPTALLKPMELQFEVGEEGLLTFGFRTNGMEQDGTLSTTCHGWFKLDNFRLSYDSEELTAVKGVELKGNRGATSFYTIDGRQLQAPQRGLNIMKTADGKTVKVLMK